MLEMIKTNELLNISIIFHISILTYFFSIWDCCYFQINYLLHQRTTNLLLLNLICLISHHPV